MVKLSEALVADGRLLGVKFAAADELILAGDLDYHDFSSPLVRKAVQLQREYSSKGAQGRYSREQLSAVMRMLKQFLTELKDGTLTEAGRHEFSVQLCVALPKPVEPRRAR